MLFGRNVRRLTYLVLITVGMVAAGCAIRDPQAMTDLKKANNAITSAKQAGAADRFPGEFADLEKRFLKARGTFYACQEDQASDMAMTLISDANALATKRIAPPKKAAPPPPANKPPIARLRAPGEGNINALLTFNADESSDPDGDELTYRWNFGDGKTATFKFPAATHRYSSVGNYTVRLTVDDGRGGTDTASKFLQIVSVQVIRSDVLFDFDKATLKPEAEKILANIVKQMKENTSYQSTLVGHTDWIGTEAYNMGLSERRAKAVRNYLVGRGIEPERVTAEWKGESEPVASNKTREGRAKNRRTEITLSPMPALR